MLEHIFQQLIICDLVDSSKVSMVIRYLELWGQKNLLDLLTSNLNVSCILMVMEKLLENIQRWQNLIKCYLAAIISNLEQLYQLGVEEYSFVGFQIFWNTTKYKFGLTYKEIEQCLDLGELNIFEEEYAKL